MNYQPLETSLARKRMLYAKMLEQGFQPQKTEMISGIAIPASKTQGFSDILKVGVGSYLGQKAENDLLALQSKKIKDKGRIFGKLMGLPNSDDALGGGSGSGSLSADEIEFMNQEMPEISKSYLNNKFADQRLTTEQKNAQSSGYTTPLEYWQGKQNYNAKIKDNALTNEQKNASASGFSNPFAYQSQLKGVDYDNRFKLQEKSQNFTSDENLLDRIHRTENREDSQKYDQEKRGDVLVKAVINGVEYEMPRRQYDAILNGQYQAQQPPQQEINPFTQGNIPQQQPSNRMDRLTDAERPIAIDMIKKGFSDAEIVDYLDKRQQPQQQREINPFTQGDVPRQAQPQAQTQQQEPVFSSFEPPAYQNNQSVPAIGRRIVSPIESGRKKLEITNANSRLAEKEKNLRGYSAVLDNLQRANALLTEGNINVGAWDGTRQFIDKNIPYFGNEKTATNTETYEGLIGDTAAQALKLFGGSDSNMELEFSKAINAGDTNMSKEALKNLIAKVQRRYAEQVQDFDNEKQRYESGDYLPDLNRQPKGNVKDLSNDDLLRQLYE